MITRASLLLVIVDNKAAQPTQVLAVSRGICPLDLHHEVFTLLLLDELFDCAACARKVHVYIEPPLRRSSHPQPHPAVLLGQLLAVSALAPQLGKILLEFKRKFEVFLYRFLNPDT